MSIQKKNNQKMLLEALDYVDVKYVDELVGGLRLPKESAAEPSAKRSFRASVKYAALIAACALLLGAVIPVAGSLIRNLTSGTAAAGSESLGEKEVSSEMLNNEINPTEEDPQVKEQTGAAFDGSPIFRLVNIDGYSQPVCEVFTADGENINLCICEETPCSCYVDRYYLTSCGNEVYYLLQNTSDITVAAYDVSDPDNIKFYQRKFGALGSATHDITAVNGTPYFYAYSKDSYTGGFSGLHIINLGNMLADKEFVLREYSSYGHLKNEGVILHIDERMDVYFGITDKKTGMIAKISKLYETVVDRRNTVKYDELFEVGKQIPFEVREYLTIDEDGSVHYFREEMNDESVYGYSLYQYIWREGDEVRKVLRAKNVCDYVLTDGYLYYIVNDPANSRKFVNYDVSSETYTDMTGGKIFRLPAFELDYKPMIAWTLGEEYYLYATTEKNKSEFKVPVGIGEYKNRGKASNHSFIQGVDGGIALWANKQVGENIMAVNLLIGEGKNGTVMTEIPGCYWWGYWGLSDVGGGTNVNWQYRP